MSSTQLTRFLTGWRGYILGTRTQWYPHQRVRGVRRGWLLAAPVHQVHQLKRMAHFLGTLFVGGAILWMYGATRLEIRARPLRDSDYTDRPKQFVWGRAWPLWWSGQLSNSVYVRWRRLRTYRAGTYLVRPHPYRRVSHRRRRPRLRRRWARLRRRGRLPRGCYRRVGTGPTVLARWWRRRVTQPGWTTPFVDSTPLYRRRWGGAPTVGVAGLSPGWVAHWGARVVHHHRRRRGWTPAAGAYRWGSVPGEWVRPTRAHRRPHRRRRRQTHRLTRWAARFQGWSTLFPGVVGTTATGVFPTLMGEAHAVGLPTALWGTGVAPSVTPWVVAWPAVRRAGLWQWINLVWGSSRGVALLEGVAHRLSVGAPPPG